MSDQQPIASSAETGLFSKEFLCHANNLDQKLRIAAGNEEKELVLKVRAAYDEYCKRIDYAALQKGDAKASIDALEKYLVVAKGVEKEHRIFNWRSDYAASIIPEFLFRALSAILSSRGIPALFATRDSVTELTLSGALDGGWSIRHKNQDLSIGLRRESVGAGGARTEFVIPVVAMEVKTNIDINKLNGLDFSAERLKRTFPAARYFLATETIDFSLADNYAAGSIDEVYVFRKQVRSQARRDLARLQHDVFEQLFADTVRLLELESVTRGHVYDRLTSGRLMGGKADSLPAVTKV